MEILGTEFLTLDWIIRSIRLTTVYELGHFKFIFCSWSTTHVWFCEGSYIINQGVKKKCCVVPKKWNRVPCIQIPLDTALKIQMRYENNCNYPIINTENCTSVSWKHHVVACMYTLLNLSMVQPWLAKYNSGCGMLWKYYGVIPI